MICLNDSIKSEFTSKVKSPLPHINFTLKYTWNQSIINKKIKRENVENISRNGVICLKESIQVV